MTQHGLVFKDQLGNVIDDESGYALRQWSQALKGHAITEERWSNGELIDTVAYEVKPLGRVNG